MPRPDASLDGVALATAALALVGDGVTPAGLARRLRDALGSIGVDRAEAILDELTALGLVRAVAADHPRRFVLTSLGQQSIESSAGHSGLADRLRELERLRTDLLSTVSHELRTPLTAIRTCVGLLLDPATDPDDAEQRVLLETIERNADRMQRLVADVLDLARYRAGHVQLQLRRFDASALARETATTIRPLADAHAQHIRLALPEEAVPVFGDHRRLEQALLNLLSNAQKFSPDGSWIDLEVSGDDLDARWSVRDRGPGIPEEDQARLFERFFVGRTDRGGPTGGVGLGLPTALAIAQAHGGGIDVVSVPGRGSLFTLRVPRENLEQEEP